MRIYFWIGLLLAGLVPFSMKAQSLDRTIDGRVFGEELGKPQPLTGVRVQTLPSGSLALTDSLGAFTIQTNRETQALVFDYLGFQTDTIALGHAFDSVRLEPTLLMDELEISHRRKSTEINMLGARKTENIGERELLKAACCNLSESFETTPSVDVGFTDAVSGYKQIQMLGLAGTHTAFTRENIPDIRGLAAITGLTFTPGAWVESMQLSKGAGSVVNGYEGTAGQINIEWRKPFEDKEPRLYLNGYQSAQGRSEGNLILSHKFNEELSTNLLLHGRADWAKIDMNKDGFLDQPLGKTFAGANRWFYFNPNGLEFQAGIKAVLLDNVGGQVNYKKDGIQSPGNPWGYEQQLNRVEVWAKMGKLFVEKPWKSMGLQLSGTLHDQESKYGSRNYAGNQQGFYANYIYQSIINNTNHVMKAGASFQWDNFEEQLNNHKFSRVEYVPGIFAEYSYHYLTKFNLVAGIRGDYHNLFGAFITPRVHMRYAPFEQTALRTSIGRALRTANIIAENMGLMASNRSFLMPAISTGAYGLNPEVAWNMGLNATQKFRLNYRDGAISADYYYTHFQNQVIVDIEQPGQVSFYNLDGRSFAHSFQVQLDYEPIRRFDVRLAYRYYDVRSTYVGEMKQKPLIGKHRAFLNLAYETKNNWKLDYTLQWLGSKRVPLHYNPEHGHTMSYSSSPFTQMNAQVSKSWLDEQIEVYVGAENLSNYMQHNLIISAADPYAQSFDGSLIWGPGMGRNFYIGFRYKLP